MKHSFTLLIKHLSILFVLSVMLSGCVTTPSPNITIVEGVTLNEPILLPVCNGLEIHITEDKSIDITGLENIEQLCIYHDSEKKRQVKGLEMALIAFPANEKPDYIAENFMLALLGKEKLLMRIQVDTNGMAVQDIALTELSKILGKATVIQTATKENFWGATEGAILAAWNTNYIEAMFIAEIDSTKLGSISLTSKNIYQHTTEDIDNSVPTSTPAPTNTKTDIPAEAKTETNKAATPLNADTTIQPNEKENKNIQSRTVIQKNKATAKE